MSTAGIPTSVSAVVYRWTRILRGCNAERGESLDLVSRWLLISRACVLPMTLTSGLLGVLLALERGSLAAWPSLLAVLGLVAAHASNNLINDWTDVRTGLDTPEYPRARYSTHPVLGGLTSLRGLLAAALLLPALDAIVMLLLAFARGSGVYAFAASGLALSLLYTVALKRAALGELASLVVWGPLMIGGTAYVAGSAVDWRLLACTLPYGIVVSAVLVGKHMDKREADIRAGVRTLPVLLGMRASGLLLKALAVSFYTLLGVLVLLRFTGPAVLLSLVALPRLARAWRSWGRPPPESPPEGWPIWPLWYVGWAMSFNRLAGMLLVAGHLLNVLIDRVAG